MMYTNYTIYGSVYVSSVTIVIKTKQVTVADYLIWTEHCKKLKTVI